MAAGGARMVPSPAHRQLAGPRPPSGWNSRARQRARAAHLLWTTSPQRCRLHGSAMGSYASGACWAMCCRSMCAREETRSTSARGEPARLLPLPLPLPWRFSDGQHRTGRPALGAALSIVFCAVH
jgi:hypothetical protein